MLKKLVKYGNSNALVLDRSILALLEIKEGSTVKLRVEGDRLIIKAAEDLNAKDVLQAAVDSLEERASSWGHDASPTLDILKNEIKEACSKAKDTPESKEMLKKWVPGTENFEKLQEAFGATMRKYKKQLEPLSSPEFQEKMTVLQQKYQKDKCSESYREDLIALRYKFAPGLEMMDKEMKEVAKNLGCPEKVSKSLSN